MECVDDDHCGHVGEQQIRFPPEGSQQEVLSGGRVTTGPDQLTLTPAGATGKHPLGAP